MKLATKILIVIILPLVSFCQTSQTGQVLNWNYVATLPVNYSISNANYPTLFFFPGLGEVGTNINALVRYGPHALINAGTNPLPGWIVISLQPSSAYPPETSIKSRIDALKQLYRIDTGRMNLTGLSHGGWMAATYASNIGTANEVNCVVTVQAVRPDDNQPYPNGFQYWHGRKYLCFEQINDGRDGGTVVNFINSLYPGRALFIQTNFSGGGHCCWNEFYGGQGIEPGKFQALNNQTLYDVLEANNKLSVLGIDTTKPYKPQKTANFYFNANFVYLKATIYTEFTICNIVGQAVRKGTLRPGSNTIPLNGLPIGIYYLTTQFNQRYKIFKWAK